MIIEKYVKMGERGQIVIPKEVRDNEGLNLEAQIKLIAIDGEIILKVQRKAPEDRVLELLKKAKFTQKDIQEIREERNKE